MKSFYHLLALVVLSTASFAGAQEIIQSSEPERQLIKVAVLEQPPFINIDDDVITGFSVDLWSLIAKDNGWDSDFVIKEDLVDVLAAIRNSEVDVALGNITITADREQVMDFSRTTFESGLQIVVAEDRNTISAIKSALTQRDFVLIVMFFLASLLLCANILLARLGHTYTYKDALSVLMSLLTLGWWGRTLERDKATRWTISLWFVVFVLSVTLGALAFMANYNAVTQNKVIEGYSDLPGLTVGVVTSSEAHNFIRRQGVDVISYDKPDRLFDHVATHIIDALVVNNFEFISHITDNPKENLTTVGQVFDKKQHGFAVPTSSEKLEPINQSLLYIKESGGYDLLLDKWFSR